MPTRLIGAALALLFMAQAAFPKKKTPVPEFVAALPPHHRVEVVLRGEKIRGAVIERSGSGFVLQPVKTAQPTRAIAYTDVESIRRVSAHPVRRGVLIGTAVVVVSFGALIGLLLASGPALIRR